MKVIGGQYGIQGRDPEIIEWVCVSGALKRQVRKDFKTDKPKHSEILHA